MPLISDLKFCLVWETERPYLDRPRQSSYFRMFAEEWYLELSLENYQLDKTYYLCSVRLRQRKGAKTLEMPVPASCDVIIKNLAFCDSSRTVRNSGDLIMRYCVLKRDLSPSDNPRNWKIVCRLSCAKPLSLQINNETINLSSGNKNAPLTFVDECVQVSSEISHDTEALSSDIFGLLKDEILPDFKLECGGRSFPVHRSVLAARSEVFRAMIRNRMVESETGSADIKDLEVPVLESFLKFLYSGKLEDLSDVSACNLYEAADKYAVHSLREACSYWMVRNLTEDNCVSYLSVSNSHSDADLKAAVMTFILDRPRVFKSSAWIKYSENHLKEAFEVLQAYAASTIQKSSDEE